MAKKKPVLKRVDVCVLFELLLRRDVYLMFKYLSKDLFEKFFVDGCGLICVDDKGGFNFSS